MEGSIPLKGHETLETRSSKRQKEGVPQSLDFEPQLFVNDVLNAVDECIEEGFEYFERQALNCLPKGSQVSKEIISKAVNDLHGFVQKKADKRLSVWERFCLEYCFKVPDEAAFPNCTNTKLCGTEILHKVEHSDEELDSRLKSLHKQLEIAQNESIDLHNEVWMLERQREKRTKVVKALAEALGPLEDSSAADIHKGKSFNDVFLTQTYRYTALAGCLCKHGMRPHLSIGMQGKKTKFFRKAKEGEGETFNPNRPPAQTRIRCSLSLSLSLSLFLSLSHRIYSFFPL
eukprot:TRINITY_DN2445_c0_g1_i4.p1 TRINITY_DN2445_c0_g1~~TRINITY_DN2445_c0_g1_i4.p1  ORF type:complete len:288 (+),score=49.97 TRINITY_DN2445_c0_g1_i4:343-1206(+)